MMFLKSKHFLRNTQTIIDKIGDENITDITLARSPLSKTTMFLLNMASLGEMNKRLNETPHDKLFHLFMVLTTSKGRFILEKNDVITMKKFTGFKPETESVGVSSIKKGLTLNTLLEKTKDLMGDKFFDYKALDNNCQFFVSSILKSNGLNRGELSTFVLQDTRKLFEDNPKFRKIVNSITDTGAITSHIKQKAEEIATQPIQTSISNELMQPIFRGLTLPNQLLKGFSNPFQTKNISPSTIV
jgi:hypothetical protein